MSNQVWYNHVDDLLESTANPTQSKALECSERFVLICGGERAGKSVTASRLAMRKIALPLEEEYKPKTYWIVGPDYRQCRPEFLYIFNAFSKAGYVQTSSMPIDEASPWSMVLSWGDRIETRSSNDITKLASFTIHGALMVEAGQQEEAVWHKLRGRVSETRGWVILVGTLENGLPWFGDRLNRWKAPNPEHGRSFSFPTWSNTDIYPLGENDPEILSLKATMPEDYYAERYAAEPRKSSLLVIPEFDFGVHMRPIQVEKNAPVELFIDPGKHTYAVGFCQTFGAFTHVFDAVYTKGQIAQEVIPQVMRHPLFPLVMKNAKTHGTIDFAGRQENANESQVTLWKRIAGVNLRSNYIRLEDSIRTLRFRLKPNPVTGLPLVVFSSDMATGYIEHPEHGVVATQAISEFPLWRRRPGTNEPVDRNNDFIKALCYYLWDKFKDEVEQQKAKVRPLYRKERAQGFYAVQRNY